MRICTRNIRVIGLAVLLLAVMFLHVDAFGDPRPLKNSTEFFNRYGGPALGVQEAGQRLWLSNGLVGIEIVKGKKGFRLARVYDIAAGQDFLPGDSSKSPSTLWQLKMRRDKGRDKNGISITNLDGGVLSSSIDRAESQITVHLWWKGMEVAGEPGALDVEVTVTVKQGDPLSRWRINVTNRSKVYGLWEVVFPVLTLVPIGEGSKVNHLVIPKSRGVVADDPFNAPRGFGVGSYAGNEWPGSVLMQFYALYDDSGMGLYLASYDGNGYRKKFYVLQDRAKQLLTYKVSQYPSNRGYPAENYNMTYDMCIGPFAGDWYDACQIYRKWGLQQKWCSQGPLTTRKDIPEWFKQAPLVLKAKTPFGDKHVEAARDRMLSILNFIGMKLPIVWYTWQQFIPDRSMSSMEGSTERVPEVVHHHDTNVHNGTYPAMPALSAFSSACKDLFEAGGYVKAFVPAKLYDPGLNENGPFAAQAKPNAVYNLQGQLSIGWHNSLWRMCYITPWWQNRLKDEVVALLKDQNAHGIYFDTFYGGRYQCFSTEHGHSYGGGNDFYIGARKLSHIVRGAMKQTDPDTIMTGESPAETAIDLLDGFLYRWTVWPEMVPLMATVYGDYICRYSMFLVPDSDGFYIQAAAMFTEGGQMGRIRFMGGYNDDDWNTKFSTDPPYTDKMNFLRKLCHYWKPQAGGRFLAYGQLLRPIQFIKPAPMPRSSYKEESRYAQYMDGRITAPVLMNGVFKTENGDLGVFIVNISDKPVECSFELTPKKYPILESASYRVTPIDQTGKQAQASLQSGRIAYKGKIGGHDVLFLQIEQLKDR